MLPLFNVILVVCPDSRLGWMTCLSQIYILCPLNATYAVLCCIVKTTFANIFFIDYYVIHFFSIYFFVCCNFVSWDNLTATKLNKSGHHLFFIKTILSFVCRFSL